MKHKISYFLFFFFVLVMIAGLFLGEFNSVLEKAITVCLSCIGIG